MLGKPDYTLATVRRVLHGREGVIGVVVTSASEDVDVCINPGTSHHTLPV